MADRVGFEPTVRLIRRTHDFQSCSFDHSDTYPGGTKMAPQAGFEPATLRLTAGCSTVELLRNVSGSERSLKTGSWGGKASTDSDPSASRVTALPPRTDRPRRLRGVLPGQAGGKSHLGVGFALRCFQRLSRPHIATQRCSWRNNWYTSGASIPVLSY